MAKQNAENLIFIYRDVVERLKIFCKSFTEAAVGGISKFAHSTMITNNVTDHREKAKVVKDDNNDLRRILVFAAGEIFCCYQNPFMLVNDAGCSCYRGIEILATDAVDRVINYITKEESGNIDENLFHEFITKGVVFGESKNREVRYNGNISNTKKLYEEIGIVKVNDKNYNKYFMRKYFKDCTDTFGYRFTFSWESFDDLQEKFYSKDNEPIINCILTNKVLEKELENILRSINSKDTPLNIQEIKDNTNEIVMELSHLEMFNMFAGENIINDDIPVMAENISNKVLQDHEQINNETKPKSIWFNMREPVKMFTGRTDVLVKLHEVLHDTVDSAVITQTIEQMASICGVGGIGKSELSRKYSIEYRKEYDNNVIWINASTHESLKESFTALAITLKIPFTDNVIDESAFKSIINDIYVKIGNRKSLFIFDNAENFKVIQKFLPFSLSVDYKKPYILITSRINKWNFGGEGIVKVKYITSFKPKEAFCFLKVALDIPMEDISIDEIIENLAKELNYFPLALVQAVAYIKMKDKITKTLSFSTVDITDYLKAYKNDLQKSELVLYKHENSRYNKAVLTTLNVTLKKIQEGNKNAIKIIEIMAYLSPDSIDSYRIFSKFIKKDDKHEDPIDLLLQYSMIQIKDGSYDSVHFHSIHRMVQNVIRFQLKSKNKEIDILEEVIKLLGFDFYNNDRNHLISIWNYACNYKKLVNKFIYKYYTRNKVHFVSIIHSDYIGTFQKILNHLKNGSKKSFDKIINDEEYLPYAIKTNNIAMVKALSELGVDCKINDWIQAIFDGRIEIVKYLLPYNTECLNYTRFYFAFGNKDTQMLNELLKELTDNQINIIMEMKWLNKYCDNNKDNKYYWSSLFSAVDDYELTDFQYHWPPLYSAARDGCLDIVKLFVNYNADINFGFLNETPLEVSIRHFHFDVCIYLIMKGASCKPLDWRCNSFLHYIIKYSQLDIVKQLIICQFVNVNITDQYQNTFLHSAALAGKLNIVQFLLGKEIEIKANLNVKNVSGVTPILMAMMSNNCDIVEYLLKQDDVNINDTIIHEKYPQMKISLILLAIARDALEIVKMLIEKEGLNIINEQIFNNKNLTIIHIAAFFNSTKVIKYLNVNFVIFDENFDRILKESIKNDRKPYCGIIYYDLVKFCETLIEILE